MVESESKNQKLYLGVGSHLTQPQKSDASGLDTTEQSIQQMRGGPQQPLP
ncbi:hypothetical protein [Microcoleus sp.]